VSASESEIMHSIFVMRLVTFCGVVIIISSGSGSGSGGGDAELRVDERRAGQYEIQPQSRLRRDSRPLVHVCVHKIMWPSYIYQQHRDATTVR
jgi:hypothetical protein